MVSQLGIDKYCFLILATIGALYNSVGTQSHQEDDLPNDFPSFLGAVTQQGQLLVIDFCKTLDWKLGEFLSTLT